MTINQQILLEIQKQTSILESIAQSLKPTLDIDLVEQAMDNIRAEFFVFKDKKELEEFLSKYPEDSENSVILNALELMLIHAEDLEHYEYCSLIRDKIKTLSVQSVQSLKSDK